MVMSPLDSTYLIYVTRMKSGAPVYTLEYRVLTFNLRFAEKENETFSIVSLFHSI